MLHDSGIAGKSRSSVGAGMRSGAARLVHRGARDGGIGFGDLRSAVLEAADFGLQLQHRLDSDVDPCSVDEVDRDRLGISE